jgi:dCMP deaminase
MDFSTPAGKLKTFTDPDLLKLGLFEINNWRIHYDKYRSQERTIEWDHSLSLNTESLTIHQDQKTLRKDLIYLQMASTWGKNSHCQRMKVGCLIVKDKSIISDGYNGSPTGFPNICEDDSMTTLPYVLHAEANAITKLAKSTQSSDQSTLYVTLSPCYECSKLIIQSGIRRVVFSELYRKPESLVFLFESGIEIVKISNLNQI